MITLNNKPIHPKCWPITNGTTACLKNVSDFIQKHGPYDFVGLQEATNWQTIQETTKVLKNMVSIHYKLDRDEIVTFYNPIYQLDLFDNQIVGHMDDINRPFIILFFNNNLAVINLHAGHGLDIYRFDEHLRRTIKNNYNKKIIKKLQNYDIIMMGDFNESINSKFTILTDIFFKIPGGRKMYGANKQASCCNYELAPIKNNPKFLDQIISTLPNIQNKVYQVLRASDHMPITATIIKNIGYDFDGVLHVEVTESDIDGQRYAMNDNGPYKPFKEIIKQINQNLLNNHQVYIITARTQNHNNEQAVKNHLEKYGLFKIPIYFTAGRSKIHIIKKLKISEYYDDSCLQIMEIYKANKKGQLPHLVRLYLSLPEKRTFVLATKKLYQLCQQNNQQKGGLIELINKHNKWIHKMKFHLY